MKTFKALQVEHERLLELLTSKTDIISDVETYNKEVIAASSQIVSPEERDQLRANLRYWAGYTFEKTQKYPNTDLLPVSPGVKRKRNWLNGVWLGGVVTILVALAFLIVSLLITQSAMPPKPVTATEVMTKVAVVDIETAIQKTLAVMAIIATSEAPEIIKTPIEEATLPITGGGWEFTLDLLQPVDGDFVEPHSEISGNYSSLEPGWSIHVLLQPLSQSGVLYPVQEYFTATAANMEKGSWSVEAVFGQGDELLSPEEYNIKLVIAMDDAAREPLAQSVLKSLAVLPETAWVIPQTTTVKRLAYQPIEGDRLIYSAFVMGEGRMEIFSSGLEGEDPIRLTFAPGISKSHAEISHRGDMLAYVGQDMRANTSAIYLLPVSSMGVDERPKILDYQPGEVYEGPTWSTDDRFLAYSVGKVLPDETVWSIGLYDLQSGKMQILAQGKPDQPARFPAWFPDSHTLIYTARSKNTGTSGFFSFNVDTEQTGVFYDSPLEENQGVISPDGSMLAYLAWEDIQRAPGLYVYDIKTETAIRLTRKDTQVWFPTWGADNRRIYYISYDQKNSPAIFALDIDEGNPRQISPSGVGSTYPSVGKMNYYMPITASQQPVN